MTVPFFQIDAFASAPFRGNPAAVCLLPAPRSATWMQGVAAEMNLSETAFVVPRHGTDSAAGELDLRWFTPTVEVDLCGHATLASAHALWLSERLPASAPACFHTRGGRLAARRGDDGWIELDFPRQDAQPVESPAGLGAALGVEPLSVGNDGSDLLVEVADEATVRATSPDFASLAKLTRRGVIVTSRSDAPAYDFVSRFFAPAAGVDEDPVTGSAHCSLGPFWAKRLGRAELIGFQASARGGVVKVRVEAERVALAGQAVLVVRGELLV